MPERVAQLIRWVSAFSLPSSGRWCCLVGSLMLDVSRRCSQLFKGQNVLGNFDTRKLDYYIVPKRRAVFQNNRDLNCSAAKV